MGKYGKVTAIIANGDLDPHDFEPTAASAKAVAAANVVIANGLVYDSWMNNLARANDMQVTEVGEKLLHLKKGNNPHIWYDLTMPKRYVNYIAYRAGKIAPKHRIYYQERAQEYIAKINKLQKMTKKIDGHKEKPVFVSEPVFDYALKAYHFRIGDHEFEEAVENETDPSAQSVYRMQQMIKKKQISFFVNNTQASSSTVNGFVMLAQKNDIPIVNVRETMPNGVSYYQWMKANYQKIFKLFQK